MQDNQLHGNLTVEEAMTVATNLKLSTKVDKSEKVVVVSDFFSSFFQLISAYEYSVETLFYFSLYKYDSSYFMTSTKKVSNSLPHFGF